MCKEFFWRALKRVYSMLAIKLFIDSQGQRNQKDCRAGRASRTSRVPRPNRARRSGFFKKASDGNYDAEEQRLVNLQKCVDAKDAANKKYVDDQFTPVMMTRNVFSKGIIMQDGRIE